jgi:biotin operon repressor
MGSHNIDEGGPGLSRQARQLYRVLERLRGKSTGCFASQQFLAKRMGVQERSIRGYLDQLREAGLLVTIRRGRGNTNLYRLTGNIAGHPAGHLAAHIAGHPPRPIEDLGIELKDSAAAFSDDFSSIGPLFKAVVEITHAEPAVNGKAIARFCQELLSADPPYTAEDIRRLPEAVREHYPWYEGDLTLSSMREYVGLVRSVKNGEPTVQHRSGWLDNFPPEIRSAMVNAPVHSTQGEEAHS